MKQIVPVLVAVATGLIGLAAFAVFVSPKSQSPQVISAAGNSFGNDLLAAVSPVTGSTPMLSQL